MQILEQDMKLICAQEDHVARTGQSLSEAFLPIKTSDTLVVELRKWLDHVGHGMPHYVGWKTRKVLTQPAWLFLWQSTGPIAIPVTRIARTARECNR